MQTILNHYLAEYDKIKKLKAPHAAYIPVKERDIAIQKFISEGFADLTQNSWRYIGRSPLLKQPFGLPSIHNFDDYQKDLPEKLEASALRFVFINGYFSETLSSALNELPVGLQVTNMANAPAKERVALQNREHQDIADSFTQLNTAFLQDGLMVNVQDNQNIQPLVELLFLNETMDASPAMIPIRNIFRIGANSQVRFFERYWNTQQQSDAAYCTNVISEISLSENAVARWSQVVNANDKSVHVGKLLVLQAEKSQFTTESCLLSGGVARHSLQVALQGPASRCTLHGLSTGKRNNQLEHDIVVQHDAPHTESSVHYRATADDTSRVVFGGNVHVIKNIQKINARQNNYNLLLSEKAEIDTKPRLELFSDDIMCTHGATVGQLDEEALWYLQTRGIALEKARAILIQAFNQVILDEMTLVKQCLEIQGALQH